MKAVERSEIIDYVTYEEQRQAFREQVMAAKAPRRIHIGDNITLLFENRLTVRYQIQEMVRAERIVKEADIRHEIDTYNELLGWAGELGCTMLIEIDDPAERAAKLRQWVDLPERVYAMLADGTRIRATFDERQRDEEKLSSVQFLKFNTGGQTPVGFGVALPEEHIQADLTEEQQQALTEDLAQE